MYLGVRIEEVLRSKDRGGATSEVTNVGAGTGAGNVAHVISARGWRGWHGSEKISSWGFGSSRWTLTTRLS